MVYRGLSHHKILAIKISKKMMSQQKFNKILQFQALIPPNHYVIAKKQCQFSKLCNNETFHVHIRKLL